MKNVYMTTDMGHAQTYAFNACTQPEHTPHVYEVEPTGDYGHRRDAKGEEFASEDPLRVIREVWRHGKSRGEMHASQRQSALSYDEFALRMLAAEESDHDVSYHITDNPHFKLDPTKVPSDNAVAIYERKSPGLYTTKNPESWVNGHDYVRPYLAEVHTPKGAMRDERWGGEGFIPAEHFDKAKVHRVIPLDEHVREEYHAPGWIESHHGKTYDTGEPVDDYTRLPKDYHYTGPDVRDMKPEQHRQHYSRWKDYMIGNRGFAHNMFNDKKMTLKDNADEDDIDSEGMFIHRDEHGNPTGKTSAKMAALSDEEFVLAQMRTEGALV